MLAFALWVDRTKVDALEERRLAIEERLPSPSPSHHLHEEQQPRAAGRVAGAYRHRRGEPGPGACAVYPLMQHVDSWKHVLLVGDHKQLPPCVLTTP